MAKNLVTDAIGQSRYLEGKKVDMAHQRRIMAGHQADDHATHKSMPLPKKVQRTLAQGYKNRKM